MKLLALCLLLLATGASANENVIDVQHDSKRGVTCWVGTNGFNIPQAMDCIPDSQLQAGRERKLSPHEQDSEPTPATAPARWNEERYSL